MKGECFNLLIFILFIFVGKLQSRKSKVGIPYSFNSLQWRHTQTQSAHLKTAHVAPLRWRVTQTQSAHLIIACVAPLRWCVYPRDQSQISAGVRKLLIYGPTSLQWVKWIGYRLRCLSGYGVRLWCYIRKVLIRTNTLSMYGKQERKVGVFLLAMTQLYKLYCV